MKNKKWLIVIISVIVIFVIGLVIFLKINKKDEEAINNTEIKDASMKYFEDTKTQVTSVMALIENDYLKEAKENKCDIIEKDKSEIKVTRNDCKEAEEIAKKPVVIIESSNDFQIDKWNNTGTTLSFKLKNNGNSYYNEESIKNVSWISTTTPSTFEKTKVVAKVPTNDKYELLVQFDDLVLSYKFGIKIDLEAPKLVSKDLERIIFAEYSDNNGIAETLYYVGTDTKAPKFEEMITSNKLNVECNTNYYVWSASKDWAGNRSSIDYLGTYKKECQKVSISGGN